MMKGISLFSSAGIAETYLKDIGIEIVVANELLEKRAKFHKHLYPDCEMIQGDIRDVKIRQKIESFISNDVNLLLATPPCQGLSTLGKNKKQKHYENDIRNYLIFDVFYFIDKYEFNYILIENVPKFLQMHFPYEDSYKTLLEILHLKYSDKYIIESDILNAKDYGVPQSRPRAIIKMYKKNLKWGWPEKEPEILLKDVLWDLPSLESGESSNIKWHSSKFHNERDILAMKHTPTGQSAFKNIVYYPKKNNGNKISGFHNTYKRMNWDSPAPARTTNSGNIGSHNNVHPGRKLPDGTYSDARVLTVHELLIVSSLPKKWDIPEWATDNMIRHVIGESIPPLMAKKILYKIGE